MRDLARQSAALTEFDVRTLHRLVLLRSAPDIGGRYADQGRTMLTDAGRHALPSPAEVPALMAISRLGAAGNTPDKACFIRVSTQLDEYPRAWSSP